MAERGTAVGVEKLMPAVLESYEVWNRRIPTPLLNRWLAEAQSRNPPPLVAGRRLRLRYMTQANITAKLVIFVFSRQCRHPDRQFDGGRLNVCGPANSWAVAQVKIKIEGAMRAAPVLASLFGILFAANASDARLTPIDWMQWQGSADPAIDPLNWDKANATFREIVWHAQNDTIKQDAYASKKLLWANGHVSVRAIIRCEAVQNYQTGETLTDCFVAPNGDPYPSKNAANSNIPWVSYWAYVKANVMPQLKSTNPSMPDWPLEEAPPLPGEPIVRQVQQDPNKYNTRYIDFAWTFTLQPGPARRPPPRRQPGISSNSGSNQAQCDELQREITFSRSRPGGQQNVVAASEEMRRLGCPGYGTQQPDIANNPVPSKADCLALQNAYNSSEIAPALSGRGKDLQQMSRTTGTQLQECWQKYWASGGAGPGGGPPPGLSCGHGLNC